MLHPFRLARILGEAEGVRLRLRAQRIGVQIGLAAVALIFLADAVLFSHIATWYWLRLSWDWQPHSAAAVIGGGDAVLAALLALLAARSRPTRAEREALEVRQQALTYARTSLSVTAVLLPVVRMVLSMVRSRKP